MRVRSLSMFLLFVLGTTSAFAASFDCTKARTDVEKRICADAEVSRLDEHLAKFYAAAREQVAGPQCLRDDQRAWLGTVRNRCTTVECLRNAYRLRLAELSALVPGALLPDDLDLPTGPTLLAFLPIAADSEPLERLSDSPLEIQGHVLQEEGAYVLRETSGKRRLHILIPDVYADERTLTTLEVLAGTKRQVRVKGFHGTTPGGDPAFDIRRCVKVSEAR